MLAELFETRGLVPRSVVRFDNVSLASAMLQAGIGVMLMREVHALEGERKGSVTISPIAQTALPVFIAHLVSRKNDPLIMAFVQAARNIEPNMQ